MEFLGSFIECYCRRSVDMNLKGSKNLTVDQLSKAKTLYNAKLDEKLEKPLREKYPTLFEEPK